MNDKRSTPVTWLVRGLAKLFLILGDRKLLAVAGEAILMTK
jgi:hypothetical protein